MKKILTAILSVAMACGIGIAAVGCAGGYSIEVGGGGSGVGISGAKDGSLDLGMASKEVDGAEEGLSVYTLCKDGIAVIVHNDNAVDDLTMEELKAIYTGETSNWSEVGGADAAITVVAREPGSGTRDAFQELVGFEDADLDADAELSSTSVVLSTVAGNKNAIGYISLGSLDDTVSAVKIGGVAPTTENVLDGSYAISRPFNVMYLEATEKENDLLADFLKFLQSKKAQEMIEEEGYISIYADAKAYAKPETLPETTKLNVGGSTSVQPLMAKLAIAYEDLLNA